MSDSLGGTAASVLSGPDLATRGQQRTAELRNSQLIDIHTHLYPEWYLSVVRNRIVQPRVQVLPDGAERFVIFPKDEGPPLTSDYWDVDQKLDYMSRLGIHRSVVSLGNPWLQWVDEQSKSEEYAERLNTWFGRLSNSTGGKLIGMGVVPEVTVTHTAEYVKRLASNHQVVAVVIGSMLCGRELDDHSLDEVYAASQDAGLPLFVHPHHSLGAERLAGYGPALQVALGFPSETSLALARLILGGVLERFPGLTVIASHGGGTIAMLAGRFIGAASAHLPNEDHLASSLQALRRIYVDSIVYSPEALSLILHAFGENHVMFGTDHPFYLAHHPAVRNLVDAIPGRVGDDIMSGTATQLFSLNGHDLA